MAEGAGRVLLEIGLQPGPGVGSVYAARVGGKTIRGVYEGVSGDGGNPGISRNTLNLMEPPRGFESRTYALRMRCSTG